MAGGGRTLAIGDVHGCLGALERLIELVAPTADDHLIFLGDYVDRGPDSAGVLDWLVRESKTRQMTTLRGNHDDMMVISHEHGDDIRMVPSHWLEQGGMATVASYEPEDSSKWRDCVPDEHLAFLRDTDLHLETDTHLFVHGGVDPRIPLIYQDEETLMWARFDEQKAHRSGKTIICGHTAQPSGRIAVKPHAICIDTRVVDGWLTCLDAISGEYWQARQDCDDTRRGNLADLAQRKKRKKRKQKKAVNKKTK